MRRPRNDFIFSTDLQLRYAAEILKAKLAVIVLLVHVVSNWPNRDDMKMIMKDDTYHTINCHVQNPSRSNDVKETVNVFENGNHHFILILRCWPANG